MYNYAISPKYSDPSQFFTQYAQRKKTNTNAKKHKLEKESEKREREH